MRRIRLPLRPVDGGVGHGKEFQPLPETRPDGQCFFADDEAEFQRLSALGAMGLLTNHPQRLRAWLEKRDL